jgi:hypothetical protein
METEDKQRTKLYTELRNVVGGSAALSYASKVDPYILEYLITIVKT